MTRKAISADAGPAALGPCSQAIVAGSYVFCSGTAGIDPATGEPGVGVEAQTELALRNLDAILTAAGTSLQALVKTTIFYANAEDFTAINAVYARFMPGSPPARSAPANVVLPRGLLISIDAVAVPRLHRGGVTRQTGAPKTSRTGRSEHRCMHTWRSRQPFRIGDLISYLGNRKDSTVVPEETRPCRLNRE